MRNSLLVKVVLCACSLGGVVYAYLEQQNDLTKLRMEIPGLVKEVRYLEEEKGRLLYEIERFESPKHLMDLAKRPEFSHLQHPYADEILVLHVTPEETTPESYRKEGRSSTIFASFPEGYRKKSRSSSSLHFFNTENTE